MKIVFDYDDNDKLVLAGVFEDFRVPTLPSDFVGLVVDVPVNRMLNDKGRRIMGIRMEYHGRQGDPEYVYMPEDLLQ